MAPYFPWEIRNGLSGRWRESWLNSDKDDGFFVSVRNMVAWGQREIYMWQGDAGNFLWAGGSSICLWLKFLFDRGRVGHTGVVQGLRRYTEYTHLALKQYCMYPLLNVPDVHHCSTCKLICLVSPEVLTHHTLVALEPLKASCSPPSLIGQR